jgi:hypothetical protein
VNAKRLFIPLTQKAKDAYAAHKQAAPTVQRVYAGVATLEKPERHNEGLVYNVDYILVKSVTIPARPMLPTSDQERAALGQKVVKIMAMPAGVAPTIQASDPELAELFGIEIEA